MQAEPELADGARDGVVRVLPADDDGRIGADAVRPRVGDRGGARGEQRGERRLRAAARERAPAGAPKPASSHIQRTTRCSITVATGDISATASD